MLDQPGSCGKGLQIQLHSQCFWTAPQLKRIGVFPPSASPEPQKLQTKVNRKTSPCQTLREGRAGSGEGVPHTMTHGRLHRRRDPNYRCLAERKISCLFDSSKACSRLPADCIASLMHCWLTLGFVCLVPISNRLIANCSTVLKQATAASVRAAMLHSS